MKKILFIDQLRAIAALFVVFWHFGVVFWYNNDAVSSLCKLQVKEDVASSVPGFVNDLINCINSIGLDAGSIGVGLFFLISGFVISFSTDNNRSITPLEFLLKRFLRIWPVYALGFGITFLCMELYHKIFDGNWIYAWKDYVMQISLLNDFWGGANLDGISWTLQIEVKFYFLFFILLLFKATNSARVISGVSLILSLCTIWWNDTNANYVYSINPDLYMGVSAIEYSLPFICFIFVGTGIYHLYAGRWSLKKWIVVMEILSSTFVLSLSNSSSSVLFGKICVNYSISFLIFINFYLFKRQIKELKFLKFVSEKSFALYLLHGINGYLLLNLFYLAGVPYLVAIALAVLFVFVIATFFELYIERTAKSFEIWIMDKLFRKREEKTL